MSQHELNEEQWDNYSYSQSSHTSARKPRAEEESFTIEDSYNHNDRYTNSSYGSDSVEEWDVRKAKAPTRKSIAPRASKTLKSKGKFISSIVVTHQLPLNLQLYHFAAVSDDF